MEELKEYFNIYFKSINTKLEEISKKLGILLLKDQQMGLNPAAVVAPLGPATIPGPVVDKSRIYSYLNKAGQPYLCSRCKGIISWDLRKEGRVYPLHVNEYGIVIGDGDCPVYKKNGDGS